uniref:Light Harvesting Complex Protein n=1 Tax=Florenciella sp. virus SA2 TaxID=3240092 RepID=A0AB39J915_9VIRU
MKISFISVMVSMCGIFGVNGFQLGPSKPVTKSFSYNGDISPTGYFDPLRLTENMREKDLKYLREAELHHGRVAMIAATMLPILDFVNKDNLAIDYFSKDHGEWNRFGLGYMAIFEFIRMLSLYKNPSEKLFELKDNAQPGMLNTFVPFDEELSNKELSNGRLAMIGALGYIVQELVTQQKII